MFFVDSGPYASILEYSVTMRFSDLHFGSSVLYSFKLKKMNLMGPTSQPRFCGKHFHGTSHLNSTRGHLHGKQSVTVEVGDSDAEVTLTVLLLALLHITLDKFISPSLCVPISTIILVIVITIVQ